VTEINSANTRSLDKWTGRSVLKPIPSHRTRWRRATLKPSPYSSNKVAESSPARTKSSETGTGHSYTNHKSSDRHTESSSARTESSDKGSKAMPSGRIFSSRLGTTGVAEFRLEFNKASALIPAVGGQFGQCQICGVEWQNFTRTCHACRPEKAETAF